MQDGLSIIMPAYRAEATIAGAIASVLSDAETCEGLALEIVIAADDEHDYATVLDRSGLADPRLIFTATSSPASGASAARNAALVAASMRFAATLDADDAFAPGKLARTLPLVAEHGLVSTGLDVVDETGRHLRYVAVGRDLDLPAGDYKFTNLSMDSMILWDRGRADPRYDPALPCMTDLEFLMRLFATFPACRHVGAPLHRYAKQTRSISNGAGVSERMIGAKTLLRQRITEGFYSFADPMAAQGLDRFLALSLAAERRYAPDPDTPGPHLFEDHLEPILLRAAAEGGAADLS